MVALLALLGIGLLAGAISGGSDDDILEELGSEDLGGDDPSAEAAPRQFGDDRQVIVDTELRVSIEDFLEGSGATEEEQADLLGQATFLTGPFNLDTGGGADVVVGSDGDDTILTGDQDDVVEGGSGNDVIQLGDGNDSYGRGVELAAGPESTPPLQLGDGAEDLQGGDDWVRGGQGDDVIIDAYGSNRLAGNEDDDRIDSVDLDEGTPDHVLGGFGNDILFVDEGDLVEVGRGLDEVFVDLGGGIAEGYDPVTIPDFTPRVDKVDVLGFDADDVSVADLEDGTGAVISVGGVPVVIVIGGQGLNAVELGVSEPAVV